MRQASFSIVSLSFNQARYLERSLVSIIEQDYPHIQHIVVDAGSSDGSRDIIEKYRDKISDFVSEPDDGPADGLNKGFRRATGDIFAFLNSDDVLLPGSLSYVARYLSQHPDVDVVSGHCQYIDENDALIRKGYSDRLSARRSAYGAAILIQPSTFFRRGAFERTGGFNVENRACWDGEFFIDMLQAGVRFAVIDRMLSAYRLHPESITSSQRRDIELRSYIRARFQRLMGRDQTKVDPLIGLGMRIAKYAENPRALIERITRGPVYGRNRRGGRA